jgi:hypothetical protein
MSSMPLGVRSSLKEKPPYLMDQEGREDFCRNPAFAGAEGWDMNEAVRC